MFVAAAVGLAFLIRDEPDDISAADLPRRYSSQEFGYSILWPAEYRLQSDRAELVALTSSSGQIIVDAGCYSSGVENLEQAQQIIEFDSTPALQTDYYSGPDLLFREISFDFKDRCYRLKLRPTKEGALGELDRIARTFEP